MRTSAYTMAVDTNVIRYGDNGHWHWFVMDKDVIKLLFCAMPGACEEETILGTRIRKVREGGKRSLNDNTKDNLWRVFPSNHTVLRKSRVRVGGDSCGSALRSQYFSNCEICRHLHFSNSLHKTKTCQPRSRIPRSI